MSGYELKLIYIFFAFYVVIGIPYYYFTIFLMN